jgi:hypothetical protein
VVHRHLNGLCIVTAGTVLEQRLGPNGALNRDDKEDCNLTNNDGIGISSIQYLVGVGTDSQSAKGKLRAKHKKQKCSAGIDKCGAKDGEEASVEDHDGRVLPYDALCRITLSDGTSFLLHCCVAGTVVDLNRRLESQSAEVGQGGEGLATNDGARAAAAGGAAKHGESEGGGGDPSPVWKEPLLDGYLAVIIPTRGSFPPKNNC